MDASCVYTRVGEVPEAFDISILLKDAVILTARRRSFKLIADGECHEDACLRAVVLNDEIQILLIISTERTQHPILPLHRSIVSRLLTC